MIARKFTCHVILARHQSQAAVSCTGSSGYRGTSHGSSAIGSPLSTVHCRSATSSSRQGPVKADWQVMGGGARALTARRWQDVTPGLLLLLLLLCLNVVAITVVHTRQAVHRWRRGGLLLRRFERKSPLLMLLLALLRLLLLTQAGLLGKGHRLSGEARACWVLAGHALTWRWAIGHLHQVVHGLRLYLLLPGSLLLLRLGCRGLQMGVGMGLFEGALVERQPAYRSHGCWRYSNSVGRCPANVWVKSTRGKATGVGARAWGGSSVGWQWVRL